MKVNFSYLFRLSIVSYSKPIVTHNNYVKEVVIVRIWEWSRVPRYVLYCEMLISYNGNIRLANITVVGLGKMVRLHWRLHGRGSHHPARERYLRT